MSTTATLIPQGTWNVDPKHSSVEFSVKHMGIATVKGQFDQFEGTIEVTDAGITAHGTIETASVNTREPQRDDHLRSPDFFDAAQYPSIEFRSTQITPRDEDSFTVRGELQIHGVTNTVELEATVEGSDVDPWGNTRVALEARGELSRGDYGMKFNQALGSGNMLVGDKVKLSLALSTVLAK